MASSRPYLAVALDGAGWHPAAWREATARPSDLFDADYWLELACLAERGTIDFLTFEDALTLQSADPWAPDERVDQVRGRLDAALLATRVAPATTGIGLVPTVTSTHTEPFHVSTKIASLDFVSHGRAGWRVQVMKQRAELAQFGRRDLPDVDWRTGGERDALTRLLFDEAADSVEVSRRLWDSWEDDAEIRDQPTGRFIDRDKLHSIDFDGDQFSVRGPSITPRPPQGQPIVAVLAHLTIPYELAARSADVVFITPHDDRGVAANIQEVRDAEARVERAGPPLRIVADLAVLIEDNASDAAAALARLDQLDGAAWRTDAKIVATDASILADLLHAWHDAGIDGFRLRPARLPLDLTAIVDRLVPELRARSGFPDHYRDETLRDRLGLARAENRYVTSARNGGAR
jgi:alkanesulfonate monooxygenase SsuD/methylene tetrahydromethanopterin reductase-like flavin-dependent oxidoreductase (luciferase family)